MSTQKKKKYSIRSLVPDITGNRPSTIKEQENDESGKTESQDKKYGAAHQEVKRMLSTLKKILPPMGELDITDETKDSFIYLMKELYPDGSAHEIYKKLRRGEELTTEELDKMIALAIDKMSIDGKWSEEQKQSFKERIRQDIGDDCWEVVDKIRKQVNEDLCKINQLENYETKKAFLQKYQELIFFGLTAFRCTLDVFSECEKELIASPQKHEE